MTDRIDPVESTNDGVVVELARDDLERKRFLKMAGRGIGAGAAATALGAFIAACGGSSSSSSSSTAPAATGATSTSTKASGGNDLGIVNYALTLEYLEAQFYDEVTKSGLFHGTTLAMLKRFGAEEHAHVAALKGVATKLGMPAAKPTGKFPLYSAKQVSKLAATVENLGASAYLGQAGNIKSKGEPCGRARDPHRRGAPRLHAELAAEDDADARWRLRQADDDGRGAQGGQALHRVGPTACARDRTPQRGIF
jgi:hypothetical protein